MFKIHFEGPRSNVLVGWFLVSHVLRAECGIRHEIVCKLKDPTSSGRKLGFGFMAGLRVVADHCSNQAEDSGTAR